MLLDTLDLNALDSVITNGTPLEQWRARRILDGKAPPLPACWANQQNSDGGWRSREVNCLLSNMGATSFALLRMAFVGLADTAPCRHTVEYLWQTQQPNGRWTEDMAQLQANPPAWYNPGDPAVDLWETANNAAALCAIGHDADPRVARAMAWVTRHVREDGTFPGFLPTTFAMASAMASLGRQTLAERYLIGSAALLERYRDAPNIDTRDLVWALMLWHLGAISPSHATVQAFQRALDDRRNTDGTWPTHYPDLAAQCTLEALELRLS